MTTTQAVIFIVIALVIGYGFGIVDSRFTAALRKKNQKPAPAPTPEPVVVEHNRPGEQTVLEVTLERASKWHLELDGVRLDDPAAVPAEKRQRLVNIIVQIRPWLEGKLAAAAPEIPAAPAAPAPAAAAVPAVETAAVKTTAPAVPTQAAPAAEALKLNAMRGFGSMIAGDSRKVVETRPTSIVSMIDAVLQTNLASSPLKDRGIRLEENPGGGVVVWVGVQRYDGIDAVPDPVIVAAIRGAIAEWEQNK